MQTEVLLIPKDRIAVLIGKSGETKDKIEKESKTKLEIDSKSGEASISGQPLAVHNTISVVKAIGRGFSPEKALHLLEPEYYLDLIDLTDYVGKNHKSLEQRRSRIIGRNGKAREEIEVSTNAFISVYGKTVGIIGREEEVERAKKAIEMLIQGSSHATVFEHLVRDKKYSKKFEL